MKKQGLVVFKTNTADFGDLQASLALRVAQDKYIAAHCKTPLAILASNWPFADNYMMSGKNKQQVLEAILELLDLHEQYGMPLKPPSNNIGDVPDKLGELDDTKCNALGLTWDIEKDTLQPIYHYHLKGKINEVNNTWEIVGLIPDKIEQLVENMVVTRTMLSKITPQSFDLSGPFLGPLKSSLKILLSRACDITSLAEKDLDLSTRDVKTLIKEIGKLNLNPWPKCIIPQKNKLWKILVACNGSTWHHQQ